MTLKLPRRVAQVLETTNGEVFVNGGITFNAKGAEQVDVKKHLVTAVFPGADQAIDLGTVNGAITLD
jgi:hypothetical protein